MSGTFFAEQQPVYQPAMRLISNITNANPAVITTTFAHNYIDGEIVRLWVPDGNGMTEVDQLFADIVVLSPTTFAFNLDTTYFTPFVYPGNNDAMAPMSTPVGEVTATLKAATTNVLPY